MALTNTRGIFALSDVRLRQNTGYWPTIWSIGSSYGYIGGGDRPAAVSSAVDRIDYLNDTATASPKGSLSLSRYGLAATGNNFYGYFGGGYTFTPTPANYSTIDRIDYSTDTATASVRGPLSTTRVWVSAAGNSSYGYFSSAGSSPTNVERVDYSNDNQTALVRGSFISSKRRGASTGNSNYGWFGGGAPSTSVVERVDYANDTATASPRGPLSAARYWLAATGNSNFGYFGGGSVPPTFYSRVDRIDYSNDTAAAPARTSLTAARYIATATGNLSYGYFQGRISPANPISTIDRIDYSIDTAIASPRGQLTRSTAGAGACSASANGLPNSFRVQSRLQTNTSITPYGYFGGGSSTNSGGIRDALSSILKLNFANDTITPSGNLTLARTFTHATGNTSYAYFAGGTNAPGSAAYSTVDRIDYSNGGVSSKGALSIPIYDFAGFGNLYYGYFASDRIDYSNDTATATPKGGSLGGESATGTVNSGWVHNSSSSVVKRIDYSNDNVISSRAFINSTQQLAATGNADYGWFGGAPASVNRIDYSNDTTSSPRGSLNEARSNLAATGNKSYGWWVGGNPGQDYASTRIDRVDYSNDTATASPKGPLSPSRIFHGATSPTINGFPQ